MNSTPSLSHATCLTETTQTTTTENDVCGQPRANTFPNPECHVQECEGMAAVRNQDHLPGSWTTPPPASRVRLWTRQLMRSCKAVEVAAARKANVTDLYFGLRLSDATGQRYARVCPSWARGSRTPIAVARKHRDDYSVPNSSMAVGDCQCSGASNPVVHSTWVQARHLERLYPVRLDERHFWVLFVSLIIY